MYIVLKRTKNIPEDYYFVHNQLYIVYCSDNFPYLFDIH